jgi:ribosome maturation factor RimP
MPISRTPIPFDRAKLDSVLEPIARAHGAEVFDVEWKSDQGSWVLRIFVEKSGSGQASASTEDAAISLDLCSLIAKDLSPALDVVDLIPHAYSLEVSSPGVERRLKSVADFERFRNKLAKVRLTEPVRGQKVLRGTIEGAAEGRVAMLVDGNSFEFPFDAVESANLVFEFGPAPKPGKSPSPKRLARASNPSVPDLQANGNREKAAKG